jgi:galactose mutarotase-like enzyme
MATPIVLRSEHAEAVLDPDRGGEIQSFTVGGSPNLIFYADWSTPLSADDGPVYGSTELDWLSRYNGGWQVLFPNAGAESVVDGVPSAFHGETSLTRLEVVAQDESSCTLLARARMPLEVRRTVRLSAERAALLLEETATNVGSRDVSFIWGHHPTFPAIAGSRIEAPGARVEIEPATPGMLVPGGSGVWPIASAASGEDVDLSEVPSAEQVRLLYLHDLDANWVAMRPPVHEGRPGVALAWDGDVFRNLWIWLQNGDPGFPWYGRSRMIGLEPQRSWPFDGLTGAIERGQQLILGPGESLNSWVTLAAVPENGREVGLVSRDGRVDFA